MDKKELEKINVLLEFLNELASRLVKKMKDSGQEQNKLIVSELYEMVEELKKTIAESGEKMPKVQMVTSPMMSQIKQYKIEVQPKIEIPEFPKFPKKISIEEAADITDILLRIVKELQQKELKVELGAVEDGLWGLQTKLAKEIDGLKKALPKIELPMEKGRIKVILPEDQVIRTPLGERISKVVRGVFLGGETINPNVVIRGDEIGLAKENGNLADIKTNTDKIPTNPATAEKQQTLKLNAAGQLEIATQTILKTIRKTLSVSGEIIVGVAGQKIYLTSLTISCNAALTVEVSWDAAPDDDEVIEAGYFAANGGLKADYSIYGPIISDAAEGLYCTITGTGNVKITAKYYQE